MKDNQKDVENQQGNDAAINQEEKGLLQIDKQQLKGWKPIEIKPKEQAEAERLFFIFFPEASHWEAPDILLPFNPTNYFPEFKQEALAILMTGIIGKDGLKGHKETFPVNQKDLIIALLDTDFKYRDVIYFPGDIIKKFDYHFDGMVAFARLSGVTEKQIKDVRDRLQKWRDKIIQAVSRSKFPSNWRELIRGESLALISYKPKSQAQAFAIILLEVVPSADDKEIAEWVNTFLKSLGRPTASESRLRGYISKKRELRPWLARKPSNNPL